MKALSLDAVADFRSVVRDYYLHHQRPMPWRDHHDLYSVLVSELMLQQTQVARVIPKFTAFMQQFPSIEVLAAAPLAEVLIAWQGLGYNRRAKFLHAAAQAIIQRGIPSTYEDLVALPGIGPNTAGAILAYAYNKPVVFIETNIRTVYIHHFFHDQTDVADTSIRRCLEQTLDRTNPRERYWAIMDYGAYLKSQRKGMNAQSKHYQKQSKFEGSLRQMRGAILRRLADSPHDIDTIDESHDDRFETALNGLIHDGLVERHGDTISLTAHQHQS